MGAVPLPLARGARLPGATRSRAPGRRQSRRRNAPESIHGKQLRIDAEHARLGSYGPLVFYRQGEDGIYYAIAREIRPFQVARD